MDIGHAGGPCELSIQRQKSAYIEEYGVAIQPNTLDNTYNQSGVDFSSEYKLVTPIEEAPKIHLSMDRNSCDSVPKHVSSAHFHSNHFF